MLREASRARWVALGIILFGFSVMCDSAAMAATGEEARMMAQEMIEAHGGLDKWRAAPTVTFEDNMTPAGAPRGMQAIVTVEQSRRRAYLDYPGTDMTITWDGKHAWSQNWASPAPPRFMALLNYYFLNLPWLTMDPGVILGDVEMARLWDDPVEYVTIRMTFEEGVGDTPDDYYVLYIHPQNKRLKACRYVVTYKALLPPGVKSTPEHLLVYDTYEEVEGLVVPSHYTIYELDHSEYAKCAVQNWSFAKPFDSSRMNMPQGAVIDETEP